ncbi:hypothetical protein FisN_24Hh166 [Fistulifera solaris]|uniref:Transmembrane protein n=1 Tax=Fistulifera solaris TaxID=1519565 RepID=A0A1Z5JUQ8_FISSO|nr:hypothetical protein FisN_24Hh166 [Fistulifera solaris]|eukprot:GAX17767.1 hypothetical protein FisN_24Hh166 [Fistulifera solaris]
MSTPVTRSPPSARESKHKRVPTDELQEKMKKMIQLQYQQQRQQQQAPSAARPPRFSPPTKSKPSVEDGVVLKDTTADPLLRFPDVVDPDVGHGTLFFPAEHNLQRLRSLSSDAGSSSQAPSKESLSSEARPPPIPNYGALDSGSSFPSSGDDDETNPLNDHGYSVDPYAENSRFLMQPSVAEHPNSTGYWIVYPIVSCCEDIWTSEALHRSLCFGAIDGMLTGSGIVATFCGMGLIDWRAVTVNTDTACILRTVVVVFCAATCFADSICMALGHIWTTHVLASTQARERSEMRTMMYYAQADVKGQLVDMLLSKGVLKIDAMSLANTLEGYPDLFLAAVMGEALTSANVEISSSNDSEYDALMGRQVSRQQRTSPHGRQREFPMDPDTATVTQANREARKESFFMMVGFSSFAVLPSLLLQWVPTLLNSNLDHKSTSVHPETMIVSIMAITMWLLGIWKSRFLDSNWFMFGVEAVLVLVVCIAAAYLVGYGVRHAFLPEVRIEIFQKSSLYYSTESGAN